MTLFRLNNNVAMPALGLGTWLTSDKNLESALNHALETGYRHIDTATLYDNEKIIGSVLKKWINSGKIQRQELFVTTKLPPIGNYPERMEKYILQSLNDLQLDYIDLYLIHSPDGIKNPPPPNSNNKEVEMDKNVDLSALWKKMEEQVLLGRTKSIGISNFNIPQINAVLSNSSIKPACLQTELNLYVQQQNLVNFCKEKEITLIGYCPLGSPGINAFYSEYGITKNIPRLLADPVVQKISTKYSKTPAQIALRFLIQQNIAAIPKSSNLTRIRENFEIFDFTLNENDSQLLKELDKGELARLGNWESWTWLEEEGTVKSS